MEIDDLLESKKTLYSITDEHGEKSTITIDKWAADLLQGMLPNVHSWVQEKYNRVCEKRPHLSRREKGDVVRMIAYREAEKSPNYKSLADLL
jgi:hypothetical protein